jgi:hypothetical protein
MNKILLLVACLVAPVLSSRSMLAAQSSGQEEDRLFRLYNNPNSWPAFDREIRNVGATSLREFSRLNQLGGFRWLAEQNEERALQFFSRAISADGGVSADPNRIGSARIRRYEEFRSLSPIPRALLIDSSSPKRYFVDPIRLTVEIPNASLSTVQGVELEICRSARWVSAIRLSRTGLAVCTTGVVRKNMVAVGNNLYSARLAGDELGIQGARWRSGAKGTEQRAVIVRVITQRPQGQIESAWNLSVDVEAPFGLVLPAVVSGPSGLEPEVTAVRGWRAHPVLAGFSSILVVGGAYLMATADQATWVHWADGTGEAPCPSVTNCNLLAVGSAGFLVGGIALLTQKWWKSEGTNQGAINRNAALRRRFQQESAEAMRSLTQIRQRTTIRVTRADRIQAGAGNSNNPEYFGSSWNLSSQFDRRSLFPTSLACWASPSPVVDGLQSC